MGGIISKILIGVVLILSTAIYLLWNENAKL